MGLNANLERVLENIETAARASGRKTGEVTLVAVTKGVAIGEIAAVAGLGVEDIGENRVQEAREKAPQLPQNLRLHLIGHLQKNKVKYARDLPLIHLIHSVDSLELGEAISRAWAESGEIIRILLQVNITGETTKGGVVPASAGETLARLAELPGLTVSGLMTMARQDDEPAQVRETFRTLRRLRDHWGRDWPNLRELSMGMSGDYQLAVEEGATILRLGRAIFRM